MAYLSKDVLLLFCVCYTCLCIFQKSCAEPAQPPQVTHECLGKLPPDMNVRAAYLELERQSLYSAIDVYMTSPENGPESWKTLTHNPTGKMIVIAACQQGVSKSTCKRCLTWLANGLYFELAIHDDRCLYAERAKATMKQCYLKFLPA